MTTSDKQNRKNVARDRAIIQVWQDIYRSKMRYQPRRYAQELDLDDDEVREIEDHYSGVDYPARLVVVNLDTDYDIAEAKKIAVRCSSKCYMDEVLVTFETGDIDYHPHYNFLFKSNVEWLADSRLIDEFAGSFKIEKNFVHVEKLPLGDYNYKCSKYVSKEGLWKLDKRSPQVRKNDKKTQKYSLNFIEY